MKTQINSKWLRQVRKDLGLTQVQMSLKLGIDPTYLSQLENGRQKIKNWVFEGAEKVKQEFENAKKVKGLYGEGGAPPGLIMRDEPGFQTQVRVKCHRHIDQFLDGCNGDREQMAWTLVELKRRFPVNPNSPHTDEVPDQIAQDILQPDSNGSGAAERNVPPSQKKLGQ